MENILTLSIPRLKKHSLIEEAMADISSHDDNDGYENREVFHDNT